jgi:hypothetical protein
MFQHLTRERAAVSDETRAAWAQSRAVGYNPIASLIGKFLYVDPPNQWLICGECLGKNLDRPNCPDCYGCGFKLGYTYPSRHPA